MNFELSAIAWKWLAAAAGVITYIFLVGRRVGRVEAGLDANTRAIEKLTERIDRMMVTHD